MNVEILQQNGYNFLWIDGQLWMWDIPIEVEIQKDIADQAYGRVVVVGLGLAVIQKFLIQNPKVINDSLLTIEKHKEVYDCCREKGIIVGDTIGGLHICDWYDAICGVEEYEKYDCVIGDIWPEINSKYLHLYKKFKEKAKEYLKVDGKILGWGSEYYEYLLRREPISCSAQEHDKQILDSYKETL